MLNFTNDGCPSAEILPVKSIEFSAGQAVRNTFLQRIAEIPELKFDGAAITSIVPLIPVTAFLGNKPCLSWERAFSRYATRAGVPMLHKVSAHLVRVVTDIRQ